MARHLDVLLVGFGSQRLASHFRMAGHRTTFVDSGKEALARLHRGESFGVIAADLRMKGMNGLGLLGRIPANTACVLVANDKTEEKSLRYPPFAYDYYVEPEDAYELAEHLSRDPAGEKILDQIRSRIAASNEAGLSAALLALYLLEQSQGLTRSVMVEVPCSSWWGEAAVTGIQRMLSNEGTTQLNCFICRELGLQVNYGLSGAMHGQSTTKAALWIRSDGKYTVRLQFSRLAIEQTRLPMP